ncbi:MAG: MBL fold metallo-hydrolase [Myxococcales bacterium]|nr:MBL fold metallo-hydrolase [Myxococcales bacterium]
MTWHCERERLGSGEMEVTWLGHSSLFLQCGPSNVLLDPVFSDRCGPKGKLGPKRSCPVPVHIEPGEANSLPPIDVVAVSHSHYDHCDAPALRRLIAVHDPVICVPTGMTWIVSKLGASRVVEFDWWESQELAGVEVAAIPARHWSARKPGDRCKSLWCGWALREKGEREAFLYVGDTARWHELYEYIGQNLTLRGAAVPIGAYEPRWFMASSHVNPDEAAEIHRLLGSPRSLAVHHRTFRLSQEAQDAPRQRLAELRAQEPGLDGFVDIAIGERIAL